MRLPKSREYTTKSDQDVNYGLWVVMMSQHSSLIVTTAPFWWILIVGEACVHEGQGDTGTLCIFSSVLL